MKNDDLCKKILDFLKDCKNLLTRCYIILVMLFLCANILAKEVYDLYPAENEDWTDDSDDSTTVPFEFYLPNNACPGDQIRIWVKPNLGVENVQICLPWQSAMNLKKDSETKQYVIDFQIPRDIDLGEQSIEISLIDENKNVHLRSAVLMLQGIPPFEANQSGINGSVSSPDQSPVSHPSP
jgi:hypothetical protein